MGAVVALAARREAARLGRVEGTRTLNMSFMFLTLDVSKFSGWLNFFAFCRVAREVIQGGGRCGLRRQGGGRLRCISGMQARATRPKHVLHVFDAGRVEAQRLVELVRVLPSRKGGHTRRGEMRAEAAGRWAAAVC